MNPLRWLITRLLGDDPPPEPGDIVPLVDADDEATAQLWHDVLRDNGVPAQVVGVGQVVYGVLPRERRILVRHGDVPRARELLELDMIEATGESVPDRDLLRGPGREDGS